MRFPLSSDGAKKLFLASILIVVSGALAIIVGLIGIAVKESENEVLGGFVGFLGILVLLLTLAGFILEIVGTNKGKTEEKNFQYALYGIIACIVFAILNMFIDNTVVSVIISVLGTVANVLVYFFIFAAFISLFTQAGDTAMVDKAKLTRIIVIAAIVLADILSIVTRFMHDVSLQTAVSVIDTIGSIISIAGFVFMMLYYKKASEVLPTIKAATELAEEAPAPEQPVEE